ncbi:MAG: VCBS repeat-containing protein, partial [Bacteroidota bacterium]
MANYIYFYNGNGVAIGDINNDGLPDILFTGNMVKNRLYVNKGNFQFENITDKAGIAEKQGWCTGATMVDINGDGNLDIYICRSADKDSSRRENLLYINNGDLTFTEKAKEYGLADNGYSTQAAFFDYDKDGDLDCFVINHSITKYTAGIQENTELRNEYNSDYASKLYRNDSGHFVNVSVGAGIISNVFTFGLGLAVSDINNDGWPDIYVSNDFNEPDYLFINQRNGTFKESLSQCMNEVSMYSMGSDAADFNNDGLVDIATLDMLPEDNKTLKMHSGNESF